MFKISITPFKQTQPAKIYENLKESIDINSKMLQMLKLFDKDFNTTILWLNK